jgi:hypothetical protein
VSAWLGRVAAVSNPPASVVAYNVGLLETPKGFSAYLVGADRFDAGSGDWLAASRSPRPSGICRSAAAAGSMSRQRS